MALYTPPSLPLSPHSYPMDAPLPPLPIELLHTWSSWRPPKPEPPLTPPLSTLPNRRVLQPQPQLRTVLPPITHFDHPQTRISPLTPPDADNGSCEWHNYAAASAKLPPVPTPYVAPHNAFHTPPEDEVFVQSHTTPQFRLDWFADAEPRSSQYLAEKTCEMICYLWFSSLSQSSSPSKRNRIASQERAAYIPSSNSSTASLQFSVSPAFVRFMQKVLETTQVSESVIVLALHYIYRMKARNRFTSGQAGSEYRVAIAALMMANKFVDDNTYTNKTWSEVSGIDLTEVNKMEKEFLLGIDFGLYVDKSTYDSWLNLLQGLVMAKERELQHWRRSWRPTRSLHRGHLPKHYSAHPVRSSSTAHRARSSSPRRCIPDMAAIQHPQLEHYASPRNVQLHTSLPSGSKRTASDAFCPDMVSPSGAPSARRHTGLTLQIPELEYSSGHSSESSASPMESLQCFSKLSLGASPVDGNGTPWATTVGQNQVPQTLASAYRIDDRGSYAIPQNLYFYALTCSPADSNNARKGRLRCHQPQTSSQSVPEIRPIVPMVIQSASASPYDMQVRIPRAPVLPPFSELSREWPRENPGAYLRQPDGGGDCQRVISESIPSAPFANAGPPGFQFYSTSVPASFSQSYEARGRRL